MTQFHPDPPLIAPSPDSHDAATGPGAQAHSALTAHQKNVTAGPMPAGLIAAALERPPEELAAVVAAIRAKVDCLLAPLEREMRVMGCTPEVREIMWEAVALDAQSRLAVLRTGERS